MSFRYEKIKLPCFAHEYGKNIHYYNPSGLHYHFKVQRSSRASMLLFFRLSFHRSSFLIIHFVCYNQNLLQVSVFIIISGVALSINSRSPSSPRRFKFNKFMVGVLLMLAAVVLLVLTSLNGNAQYYLTINELAAGKARQGSNVRVSGVVLGDTIHYDPRTLNLSFTVANIPGDNAEIEALGGLAAVLHNASIDPAAKRLNVVYNGARPDLLTNEAQAIMTGKLGEDGIFYADELLLKCPSRYADSVPSQVAP